MAENFIPWETVSLTAQSVSAFVSFSLAQSANDPDCLITNSGSQIAFISFGIGTSAIAGIPAAGALNAIPVLPGESIILHKGQGNNACAAIAPSGSTTLYFTAGQGN